MRPAAFSRGASAFAWFSSHLKPVGHFTRVYGTKNTAHIDHGMRTLTLDSQSKLPSAFGRLAPAFDAGDGSEPMDQYQEDFKRQNLGAALGVDQNAVERLLQIDQKYKAEKRQAMLLGRANFIEIDLLRGGSKMPMLTAWPKSYSMLR